MKDKILKDFLERKEILDSFKDRIINLLSDLLRYQKITIHQISGRTKDYESLSKKIDRKISKYSSIDDITDLVGIRIISYLESEVDVIAELIKQEFKLDEINSIDKRDLKSDQFGYKSLHLVVSLNDSRSALTEYKDYLNFKCEIQIRSILQHAWAEIEHDLGYKTKSSIPLQYERNFNRLAALLETGDVEFDRLKKELAQYESVVGELIKTAPQSVPIDQASLSNFNLENPILIEAREFLAELKNCSFESEPQEFFGITERFKFFDILTIKDLEDSLKADKELFFQFIKEFTKAHSYDTYLNSIILYYYQHFLAAKTNDPKKIMEYLNYGGVSIDDKEGTFPEKIIETLNRSRLQLLGK